MDLYITISIIFIGVFFFVKDYFSVDTTSILIMALFIVSGVLNPEEGFSGFNHPATLTLGCMFVVSAAVFKSGIIDSMSGKIIKIAKTNYLIALILFCLISATFSAFINDAAVVALLIPLALSVCRETGISPSKLMIPISFSALFGGTCTLIGTSTNILVSSYAEKSGLSGFEMFEFALPALCLLGIGLLYLFIIGPFILPKRKLSKEVFINEAEKYMTEIQILDGNKDHNTSIENSQLVKDFSAQILTIDRNNQKMPVFDGQTLLFEGDLIKVLLNPEKLTEIKENKTYQILADKDSKEIHENLEVEKKIYEMMVPHGSAMAGFSLKTLNFRNTYNSSVLALKHRDETITKNLSDIKVKEGDMLLIYGKQKNIDAIVSSKLLVLLSAYSEKKVNYKKAIPAILIAIGVVLAAALDFTSILISGMIGCLILVTTAIIKPKEAYDAIEWKVIFMMAGVLSMGTALEKTGGARIISEFAFEYFGGLDPRVTLSLIFLTTFLSTNVLSSKATAALMAPIVISLAQTMELSEKPFLVAVMFACSLTFMSPMSYPTNTMVYGPGNYKFKDFLMVGTPLNILIWIAASFIIPLFIPF